MNFIRHRVNKIKDLANIDKNHGVEIDLRADVSDPQAIHVSHEAWEKGDSFDDWLKEFAHQKIKGTIILNTKEDGLEELILKKLASHKLDSFFFLDTALPTLIKWTTKQGLKKFAIRYSQYEPLEFVMRFKGLCDWVWVDCFDCKPMAARDIGLLAESFKVCLVSPELQGGADERIEEFKAHFATHLVKGKLTICTKKPELWDGLSGK